MKTITLSDEAYAMLCGLVAPSDEADETHGVNHQGISGDAWNELREKFPVNDFWAAAYVMNGWDSTERPGKVNYYPDAGL